MMVILRRLVQTSFLLLFLWLFLQTESKGDDELGYPVKVFLDAYPLIYITTALASRSLEQPLLWALAVIILTVILGRVFCGWICPFGTLHNLVGALGRKKAKPLANGYRIKYCLLISLLAASFFTLQPAGILDPMALLIRSLTLAVYPAFQYGVASFFDTLYATEQSALVTVSEYIYGLTKRYLLSFQQPLFFQSALIGGLFVMLLLLNLRERRFWCKYLCPLGAMLGLLSRYALLNRSVSEGCDRCGICAQTCQGGAGLDKMEAWKKTECLMCMNCDDACPQSAVRFKVSLLRSQVPLDLGKRHVLVSFFSGLIAVPLFRVTPLARTGAGEPLLIRPPGSLAEQTFLRKCVKCGECMKVCLTNGLQPTLWEAGLEGIWSPILVPRVGYCEYRCTLCGQVCPTGAIRKLSLQEKAEVRIGLAMIYKSLCLPFAHGRSCIVCEEVCPTPDKAIRFETVEVTDRNGQAIALKQPHVNLERCIGCGICENKCPVLGRPAIRVTSLGESRSTDNQLLLM